MDYRDGDDGGCRGDILILYAMMGEGEAVGDAAQNSRCLLANIEKK